MTEGRALCLSLIHIYIPLPSVLTECLREAKEVATSEYVVANRDGGPLSYTPVSYTHLDVYKRQDIASRSDTYTGLLSNLTLASDHRQNRRNRGLSDEEIDRLGYRTTPVVGMQTIARRCV